jgi:transposase-like protein
MTIPQNILDKPYFVAQDGALAFLESLRWPEGPVCPHCGSVNQAGLVTGKGARPRLRVCRHCRSQFRATMGCLMQGSHIPAERWFQIAYLLVGTYRGISLNQLSRYLELTNKTAQTSVRRLLQILRHLGEQDHVRAIETPYRLPANALDNDDQLAGLSVHARFAAAAHRLGVAMPDTIFEALMGRVVNVTLPDTDQKAA